MSCSFANFTGASDTQDPIICTACCVGAICPKLTATSGIFLYRLRSFFQCWTHAQTLCRIKFILRVGKNFNHTIFSKYSTSLVNRYCLSWTNKHSAKLPVGSATWQSELFGALTVLVGLTSIWHHQTWLTTMQGIISSPRVSRLARTYSL